MRIVVDVTPLALRRTGIGNYVLGMLRGLAEAGDEHELVAFSAVAPPGKRRIEQALDGVPANGGSSSFPPKSHWWRTAWSRLGRGPVEWLAGPLTSSTSRTGCIRRSAAASAPRRSTICSRCAIRTGSTRRRTACTRGSTRMRRRHAT